MTLITEAPAELRQHAPPSEQREHYRLHMLGCLFPLSTAAALYGWRSLGAIALVIGSTALAIAIWRRVGWRGSAIRYSHGLWLAMLLAFMLPPHLSTLSDLGPLNLPPMVWTLLPAAALLLVLLLWTLAGTPLVRLSPLLLTYLVLVICCQSVLHPHVVLHRAAMFSGDVLDLPSPLDPTPVVPSEEAWIVARGQPAHDALYVESTAAQRLTPYTRGHSLPSPSRMTLADMLQGDLPPLEDLVVGGHPGPLGASSAIAVIIGGLFLLYRGLIDYRIPLLTVLSALVTFLLLPVPTVLSADGGQWRSLAIPGAGVDWATIMTFVSYELMASPLFFTAFFLATTAAGPLRRKGIVPYAILLGVLCAACQLYVSVALGPYLALGVAALLTARSGAETPGIGIDSGSSATHPPTA